MITCYIGFKMKKGWHQRKHERTSKNNNTFSAGSGNVKPEIVRKPYIITRQIEEEIWPEFNVGDIVFYKPHGENRIKGYITEIGDKDGRLTYDFSNDYEDKSGDSWGYEDQFELIRRTGEYITVEDLRAYNGKIVTIEGARFEFEVTPDLGGTWAYFFNKKHDISITATPLYDVPGLPYQIEHHGLHVYDSDTEDIARNWTDYVEKVKRLSASSPLKSLLNSK